MGFKLDNMQGLYFTPKELPLMFFVIKYCVFYRKVIHFKNVIDVSDEYLVGETVS